MIIDCIADLHGFYPTLEGGDLLIVAGDLTARDEPNERVQFLWWLADQTYRKKIWIAGNHDNSLVGMTFSPTRPDAAEYLCDSGTEFEGLRIWGSPWTKTFEGMNPKCKAFTVDTEDEMADKMESIPHDIDILITHSPPHKILDKTVDGKHVGSRYLYNWFKYCGRPQLHVCGHIHESYGEAERFCTMKGMVKHVNASHVNEKYQPVNKPIRIIL